MGVPGPARGFDAWQFGSPHLTWLLDGCFVFGSVARFSSGSGPPFHPSTLPHLGAQCRVLTGTDPLFCAASLAVFRSPSTLRSPSHSHSHLPLPNSPASTVDDLTNLVHFQPRISRFALAWPSTPLPLRRRFEFLSSSSITCPPNSPALSCFSALAVQPLHRYASSTCIRPPRRGLSGSRASPWAASSISPPITKQQSSFRSVGSRLLTVASDRACI
jgi:hypothetical protein